MNLYTNEKYQKLKDRELNTKYREITDMPQFYYEGIAENDRDVEIASMIDSFCENSTFFECYNRGEVYGMTGIISHLADCVNEGYIDLSKYTDCIDVTEKKITIDEVLDFGLKQESVLYRYDW